MNRAARPLVTALVVLLLLGTALLLPIPLRECTVCRGVARRLQAQGVPHAESQTGCPSCRDRGHVTLLRSLLVPKIDPRLCAMIQDNRDGKWGQYSYFSALSLLGQDFGDLAWMYSGRARFAGPEGDECLVAIVEQTSYSIPGTVEAHCWLFDMDGKPLEHLASSRSSRRGGLDVRFVQDSPPDGAVIQVDAEWGRILFWERGKKLLIRDDRSQGSCRLAVRDRKFTVLP